MDNLEIEAPVAEDRSRLIFGTSSVSKRVRGHQILTGIDVVLRPGEVTGLAGRNGAGKSTLLDLLAGVTLPSGGAVHMPRLVAYVPERIGFVEHRSGLSNLRLLSGLRCRAPEQRIRAILSEVGLDPGERRAVRHYSLGMRQRLAIAQALMEEADVLLLDEPGNGLDPPGIAWLRRVIREEADRGAAVVVSSHQLTELESVSNDVIVLADGRVAGRWTQAGLSDQLMGARVTVSNAETLVTFCRTKQYGIRRVGGEYVVRASQDPESLLFELVTSGVRVRSYAPLRTSLEDLLLAPEPEQEIREAS